MPRIPQSDHPIPIGRTLAVLCGLIVIGGSLLVAGVSQLDRHFGREDTVRQETLGGRLFRTASMEQGR